MKKLVFLVSLGALFVPNPTQAQSALNGTWKVDMSKVDFSKKPDVFLLQNGMYECKTCTPPYKIKADGSDQAVTGHPYVDTVAIKVVNDHEIQETDKKGGKTVGTSTVTVAPDGKIATFSFSDSSDTNGGPPVTGKGEEALVTKGPAGSHAVSGSWRTTKFENLSDNAISWSYKVNGDQITMSSATGQTYTTKVNGPDAPMKGDPGVTSVSVKMLDKNTFEETDKRDGKAISVFKMVIAPDGKSAQGTGTDLRQGKTNTFRIVKQ